MRKQYYFRPSAHGFDAWDVDRLVERCRGLEPHELELSEITELDTAHWFGADGSPMTVRIVAEHARLIGEADLRYPIILNADGRVMDGMHRVARAYLEGRDRVLAVRLAEEPPPDFRDCRPEELDY